MKKGKRTAKDKHTAHTVFAVSFCAHTHGKERAHGIPAHT